MHKYDNSSKPLVRIGMLGAEEAGKTTLASAIVRLLAERGGADINDLQLLNAPPVREAHGARFAMAQIECETRARRILLHDWPSEEDFLKSMITGAAALDGVIFAGKFNDPENGLLQLLRCGRLFGLDLNAVYLTKCDRSLSDMFDEDLEIRVSSMRRGLARCGYTSPEIPVLHGSARWSLDAPAPDPSQKRVGDVRTAFGRDTVQALIAKLDSAKVVRTTPRDQPFLMRAPLVQQQDRPVLSGTVACGALEIGDMIEIVHATGRERTRVRRIEMFGYPGGAVAGDEVSIVLAGIEKGDVDGCRALAAPGAHPMHSKFEALAYALNREEGGSGALPPRERRRMQFQIGTETIDGHLSLVSDASMMLPGDVTMVNVELDAPTAIECGLHFVTKDGGRTVGAGVVSDIQK